MVECLKTDATRARTFVLRLTFHCFTTAPHLPYVEKVQAKIIYVKKWDFTAYTLHSSYMNYILYFFSGRGENC
jgi:hypothetical protein